MTPGSMRRTLRATLAVAGLALAGCSADPPLAPAAPRSARMSATEEAQQPPAGESRSIYVIGSGRSGQSEE